MLFKRHRSVRTLNPNRHFILLYALRSFYHEWSLGLSGDSTAPFNQEPLWASLSPKHQCSRDALPHDLCRLRVICKIGGACRRSRRTCASSRSFEIPLEYLIAPLPLHPSTFSHPARFPPANQLSHSQVGQIQIPIISAITECLDTLSQYRLSRFVHSQVTQSWRRGHCLSCSLSSSSFMSLGCISIACTSTRFPRSLGQRLLP